MAGLVALVMWMVDSKRNPCERVRDHFCEQDPARVCSARATRASSTSRCTTSSAQMRANIKAQCLSKIERLKEEDGIDVK